MWINAGVLSVLGILCIVSGGCQDSDKAKQKAKERALASLPYMNSYPVTEPKTVSLSGVTVNNGASVQSGLNLFGHCGGTYANSAATKAAPAVVLIDQTGKTVHQWSSDIGVPVGEELNYLPSWFKCWRIMELTSDGDLLVLSAAKLLKLDWDSNLLWKVDDYFHHDVHQSNTGDIYAIASNPIFPEGRDLTIADNHIVALSPQGKEKWRISLYEVFRADEEIAPRLEKKIEKSFEMVAKTPETLEEWDKEGKIPGRISMGDRINRFLDRQLKDDAPKTLKSKILTFLGDKNADPFAKLHLHEMIPFAVLDPMHTNSVFVLPASKTGLWQEGDLLVSVRELDLLAIINPKEKKVGWRWFGPEGETMHHATLLENGNILFFENGAASKNSRVIELTPETKEIVWSYPKEGNPAFYSHRLGGVQRLPNGNTLIADATNGHAIEVDSKGTLHWEYYNKAVGQPPGRDPIYRMTRILPPLSDVLSAKQ